MPHGLPKKAIERINAVLQQDARIRHVWLFGSRAMGTFKDASDIDLCIEAPDLQVADLLALESSLDDLLLPWKIDLVARHMIDSPDLLQHIRRVGILLWPNTMDTPSG